jgi:hypothetical protein
MEVGHTTRAVLHAVCEVSRITAVWSEVGASEFSFYSFLCPPAFCFCLFLKDKRRSRLSNEIARIEYPGPEQSVLFDKES